MPSPESAPDAATPALSTARWQRAAALFDTLIELPPDARDAALRQACADDAHVRTEVLRMLAAAEAPDALIDRPARERFDALLPDLASHGGDAPRDTADPGDLVGPFQVVREIGRGGMGIVYLAERADGQFTQRAALKLIKRGMDTDFVLRRFRAERQILASLSHPNISRLIDGGTTADGRPYFAMEHIEGTRIDAYVRGHALTLEARLRLFLGVCDAVAYAHQQLVVHRDIKPANILVTADGHPCLLDFGIAGLLDDDGAGITATGVRALTPEYASPEQADGARVGTATDVWSLGVVLYELLTGELPHVFAQRSPADVAAQLRSTEPTAPSSAASRSPETRPWHRQLRGDLDTIVLTALRREPERRYASVEALATDLRRHLDGLPIQARPGTIGYRVTKFVQRNRALTAGAALLLLTMLVGSLATAWQARVARAQAARAERRFNDLRTLAHAVLFDYHDAVVNLPGSTPVRARLVKDGLAYLDELSSESGSDRSLRLELAEAYQRMGDVQGGSMRNNLGNSAGAIASYRKSLALLDALWREDSGSTATRETLSKVLSELGVLHWEAGSLPEARLAMQRAERLLAPQVTARPADSDLRQELSVRHEYLGQIAYAMGNSAVARTEYGAALATLDTLDAASRGTASVRRAYSVALQHLGELLLDAGEPDSALRTIQRVVTLRQALAVEEPLNAELQRALAVSYYYEGETLARLGRFRDAMASYRRDLDISRQLQRVDPGNALYRGDIEYAHTRIGDMLAKSGDVRAAISSYTASYSMRAADVAADSTSLWKRAALIESQAKIAESHGRLGEVNVATPWLQRTESAMDRTVVDSTDASIRSFFAETWEGLGLAWLDVLDADRATASCAAAQRLLGRADALLADMVRRRQASNSDSTRITRVRAQRTAASARCPAP